MFCDQLDTKTASFLSCLALFNLALVHGQDLQYPVVISRPALISEGDKVNVSCKSILDIMSTCQWTTPDGGNLYANISSGVVTNDDGEVQSDLQAFGSQGECGLSIASLAKKHIGQWTCGLRENQDKFQRGTFHLLDEDAGYVKDVRLPEHITPMNYKVLLTPFISADNFTIAGMETFTFTFDNSLANSSLNRKVILHYKEIAIHEESIACKNETDEELEHLGTEYDLERQFFIIHMQNDLPSNQSLTCSFNFTAILNDELAGFYRSSYTDKSGNTVWLGTTQFQDVDARRAFPCLDEPNRKATFDISLGRKKGMTAVSNMPRASTRAHPDVTDYEIDTFETSLNMSTYLVAFLVSDFEKTETEEDKNFTIWHIDYKASQAELAADAGPKILKYMEEYFGIEYPLNKTDMVALPDFAYGAMENWGLITYRETALLFEDGVSSWTDKERVVRVISHELAHMWFGNLVTMEWWEDLWLNEGFATYIEDLGTDFYDPNFQNKDRAVLFDLQYVFGLDALETSKPISVKVDNPYYDKTASAITYSKGNCLIRMIENFITLGVFREGINNYLTKYEYSNAVRENLWEELDAAAKEAGTLDSKYNISDIMESWTAQPGYPVVTVTNREQGKLMLSQKRFLLNLNANGNDEMYFIPLNVDYPGGFFNETIASDWIEKTESAKNITIRETGPYILNVRETGYYRVNYDIDNWNALVDILNNEYKQIGRINRAQIMDDSFNLARAGQLDYDIPLALSEAVKVEDDFIPTSAAMTAFEYLDLMFRHSASDYANLQKYVKALLLDRYDELEFDIADDDKYIDARTKRLFFAWMCQYKHQDCTDKALVKFNEWKNSQDPDVNNPVKPDLKPVVYNTAGASGDRESWDFMYKRFLNTDVAAERKTLIYGMGSSEDESILRQFLNMSIDASSGLRKQDTVYVYRAVGANRVGRKVQFDWLNEEFDRIYEYYQGSFSTYVDDLINGFSDDAKTQEDIDSLQKFLDEKREYLGGSIAIVETAIDRAKTNMAWNGANYEKVNTWLANKIKDKNTSTVISSSNVLITLTVGTWTIIAIQSIF